MDFHTKSYKSPDPEVPIQSLYICMYKLCNTNSKLGLPVDRTDNIFGEFACKIKLARTN